MQKLPLPLAGDGRGPRTEDTAPTPFDALAGARWHGRVWRIFQRPHMNNNHASAGLENDPRWHRLHDRPWVCPSCGATHVGTFDLAYAKPDAWPGNEEYGPNSTVSTSTHFLSEDFCVLNNEHHFVRCILELPILGADTECFAFGTWSTLSKKNFALYTKTFDSGNQGELGPWFGWFSNRLRGYPDTFNLKCQVHLRSGRVRPHIQLEPFDHPLVREQRDGITFDRLLEIYGLHGHDLKAALTNLEA
jgi:hypothetical protein